jgi:glycosyltransferase involved in cell wall biosynthesis
MWLIEALKEDHDVTVVTTGGWDLAELNDFYGTRIREDQVKLRIAPVPWPVRNLSAAALRGACFQRFAREIAGEYDARISAYDPTDWGLPAIHFIADFSWHRELRERFDPPTPGFIYRDTWLRRLYLKMAASYANPSGRDALKEDILIANSRWTARLLRECCGVDCAAVVYPPVWTEFPEVPWERKENAFVMIGRVAPEKRIEDAVAILDALRRRGHAIRFHLCGEIGNDPYGRTIAKLCRKHADWIIPEGQVSGARKAEILARCRYGIQTRSAEPFGISAAEMIKAGAVVFARDDGGQVEILDHPSLLFADVNEAIEKTNAVLSRHKEQEELRGHLAQQYQRFDEEKFVCEFRTFFEAGPTVAQSVSISYRPRVIIGHPWMGRGGSEAAVMWLIEALKEDHDVTVVTTGGWDLAELNDYYGTRIGEDQVKLRIAPVPWPARNLSAAALRGACFQRFARQIAGEYDVRISAYNPTDWGLPAIHFIADFSWHRELRERFDPPTPGFIYRDSWLRRLYLKTAASYANPSGRDILTEDRIIANSRWSAELMRKGWGVDCVAVVYPPVWTEFPEAPWEEKENAFVMLGRVAQEKRIEDAIAILDAVRQRGHAIQLHLCGEIGSDSYGRRIALLCQKHADWIIPEGYISGARKIELLGRCRYGIQTRSAEPFGISLVEMIKAGAIVFAHNDGGQVEILDQPSLLFADTTEAVEKIHDALSRSSLQSALRIHLGQRANLFSAQTFMKEVQAIFDGNELPRKNAAREQVVC